MKNLFLLLIFIFTSGIFANAQTEKELKKHREKVNKSLEKKDAVISLDTLFFAGKPMCLATIENKGVFAGKDYIFKSFEGAELIYCKYEINMIDASKSEPYYAYTFFESGLKAEDPYYIGVDKPYEKVAKKGLIKEGKTDAEAIKRFVMVVGNKFTDKQNNGETILTIISGNNTSGYKLVERNKQGMVMVMGKDLMQSNVKIGYFTKTTELVQTTSQWVTRIYLPDGTLVAQVATPDLQPASVEVITKKDNKWHTVTTGFGSDTRDIADYLIRNLYL